MILILDGLTRVVAGGAAIDVPMESADRVENPGPAELLLMEAHHGSHFWRRGHHPPQG